MLTTHRHSLVAGLPKHLAINNKPVPAMCATQFSAPGQQLPALQCGHGPARRVRAWFAWQVLRRHKGPLSRSICAQILHLFMRAGMPQCQRRTFTNKLTRSWTTCMRSLRQVVGGLLMPVSVGTLRRPGHR